MSSDDPSDPFARMRARRKAALRRRLEQHRARDEEGARRRGKRPLTAEAIATAAVAIADAQGLEEVSMRKVAAVLGAGTMSLYHYVRTKEDLMAAMDDVIMGEILVEPHELTLGWRAGLTAISRHTRDTYRRHPWALTLRNGGRAGLNGLRHMEQSLAVLADTGLSFEDKMSILIVVDDFVFGHSLRGADTQFGEPAPPDELLQEIGDYMSRHLASGQFPEFARAVGDQTPVEFMRHLMASFEPGRWFETGLAALLDGIEKRYAITAK